MEHSGVLFILCGPSGVGKTSLGVELRARRQRLTLSVSYTTRPRREGEVDGVHYHFVGRQAFAAERDAGALAEWAEVHRNFYATPKAGIARAFEEGQDVLFDIDYQGAEQLQQAYPEQCVSVLVVPPSMEELEERLRGRGTDPEEVVQHRLKAARGELAQHPVFDYIVVNDDFEFALQALTSIYDAARHGAHLHRRLVERMLG